MLVAVERDLILGIAAVQQLGNRGQPRQVGRQIAVHLDLEVRQPLALDAIGQRLGQPVVQPLFGRNIAWDNRIGQAHRVPHVQLRKRCRSYHLAGRHPLQLGVNRPQLQAEEIGLEQLEIARAYPASHCVDQGALHERTAVDRRQPVQAVRVARRYRLRVTGLPYCKEWLGRPRRIQIRRPRRPRRPQQIGDIVFVAFGWVFVEPLRREDVGRNPLYRRAVF